MKVHNRPITIASYVGWKQLIVDNEKGCARREIQRDLGHCHVWSRGPPLALLIVKKLYGQEIGNVRLRRHSISNLDLDGNPAPAFQHLDWISIQIMDSTARFQSGALGPIWVAILSPPAMIWIGAQSGSRPRRHDVNTDQVLGPICLEILPPPIMIWVQPRS